MEMTSASAAVVRGGLEPGRQWPGPFLQLPEALQFHLRGVELLLGPIGAGTLEHLDAAFHLLDLFLQAGLLTTSSTSMGSAVGAFAAAFANTENPGGCT